jgi:hypothetical protein
MEILAECAAGQVVSWRRKVLDIQRQSSRLASRSIFSDVRRFSPNRSKIQLGVMTRRGYLDRLRSDHRLLHHTLCLARKSAMSYH